MLMDLPPEVLSEVLWWITVFFGALVSVTGLGLIVEKIRGRRRVEEFKPLMENPRSIVQQAEADYRRSLDEAPLLKPEDVHPWFSDLLTPARTVSVPAEEKTETVKRPVKTTSAPSFEKILERILIRQLLSGKIDITLSLSDEDVKLLGKKFKVTLKKREPVKPAPPGSSSFPVWVRKKKGVGKRGA